ncbi:MAG: FAD-binding protein [Dehalococcoidia bacterium]|nr:FAD-binding protein [Dehalococcoidia bacterium]
MADKKETRKWDAEVDVIVVGFGGAGACAALEAAQKGASVLVLDRFHGGGATAASGAIIYAGGGTPYQKAAGFDDTPDEMYKYLKQEVGEGVMSDETLRRFCEGSAGDIQWLADAGVPFEGSMCPFKTSYPTDLYYLYFSGSENNEIYKAKAKPAPRGHRAKGPGISGLTLFHSLEETVRKQDKIQVRCQSQVTKLIRGEDERVIGVEARSIPPSSIFLRRFHGGMTWVNAKLNTYMPPMASLLNGFAGLIMTLRARPYRAKARKGVILAAGGFIFNKKKVSECNSLFCRIMPLGTYADDGSGIALGESVGGVTSHMDKMAAWTFYVPPEALMQGVLVGKDGKRLCAEDLYGAKQGQYIATKGGGYAYLILDSKTFEEAKSHVKEQCAAFQKLAMTPMLRLGRKKAPSFEELAKKIGVSAQGLAATMKEYNEIAKSGRPDPLGKFEKRFVAQDTPPFYAMDISFQGFSAVFTKGGIPVSGITLGGLVVNEKTGEVVKKDGSSIEGLYAAGRNAVGLCGNGYFASGTSIADCIFAGRRAGGHAASRQPG